MLIVASILAGSTNSARCRHMHHSLPQQATKLLIMKNPPILLAQTSTSFACEPPLREACMPMT